MYSKYISVLESLSSQASYLTTPGILAFSGCNSSGEMLNSENANSSICIILRVTALLSYHMFLDQNVIKIVILALWYFIGRNLVILTKLDNCFLLH